MHVSVAPEALFNLGPITVTNSMLTGAITTVILIVALLVAVSKLRISRKPLGGFAGIFEATCEAVVSQAEQVYGSRELALQYFPLLATLFLFILTNNWLELLPGFNTFTYHGQPIFRAVTADLNTTIDLAIVSVVLTQVYAVQKLGAVGNIKRYFVGGIGMNVIGVLEIFLELTRVISFSFRLFGNIFAGDVLLIIIASLVPIIGPSPFWGFELFVGFIQAFVFTMLTMVFIAMAISHEPSMTIAHEPEGTPAHA